jgi:hypothetical protein
MPVLVHYEKILIIATISRDIVARLSHFSLIEEWKTILYYYTKSLIHSKQHDLNMPLASLWPNGIKLIVYQ